MIVTNGNLNLRPRESGKYEEHPQPGLHWGFGLLLGKVNNIPEPCDVLSSSMLSDIGV
ncbi:MAG TPA: hypothetical protein VGU71_02585 [Candidatus Dormibacteraeota bacterium]|nr:hypothetical protein [Candidatus Dormibacteraeota bacterium]